MKLKSIINTENIKLFFAKNNIQPLNLEYKKVYLSIAAILKNEAPYIREWIEFHKLIGVERFYLYDNDSDDNVLEILAPYIKDGTVIYHHVKGDVLQFPVYRDVIYKYKNDSEWIAFIDLGEFIVPVEDNTLPEFLKKYEKYPAVGINWLMFDCNGHQTKPDGLVIENYTRVGLSIWENKHIKSIVRPKEVIQINNPHCFFYKFGKKAVDVDFCKIKSPYFKTVNHNISKIRINHYHCKSVEEYKEKCDRGRSDTANKRPFQIRLADFTQKMETSHDYVICEKYLPILKNILNSDK